MANEIPILTKDLASASERLLRDTPTGQWHPEATRALRNYPKGMIAVACSGGADSVFSLLLLNEAFPELRNRLIVLHYDHSTREGSALDAVFASRIAEALEVPFILGKSPAGGKVDEGTLRDERLGFFLDACTRKNAGLIVQGHNQDDVAETILWRLSRGAGAHGLCAPKPVQSHGQVSIIRPFLTISRSQIRNKLSSAGIEWREDESNYSEKYLRNRIRKNSLDQLKKDVDRDLLKGFSRSRELLEEQALALNQWSADGSRDCLCEGSIDTERLVAYPRAVQRMIVSDWLNRGLPRVEVSSYQLDRVIGSLDREFKFALGPSAHVANRANRLEIMTTTPGGDPPMWSMMPIPLEQTLFLPGGKSLRFSVIEASRELLGSIMKGEVDQRREAFFACSAAPPSFLGVRPRKPGDTYRPIGSPGARKVKAWMIDRKVKPETRSRLPMVVDSRGEIIWIPGFAPADTLQVRGLEKLLMHLTYH